MACTCKVPGNADKQNQILILIGILMKPLKGDPLESILCPLCQLLKLGFPSSFTDQRI